MPNFAAAGVLVAADPPNTGFGAAAAAAPPNIVVGVVPEDEGAFMLPKIVLAGGAEVAVGFPNNEGGFELGV